MLVAILKQHTVRHSMAKLEVPTNLNGYVSHVRLAPLGSRALETIGVYMPTASED